MNRPLSTSLHSSLLALCSILASCSSWKVAEQFDGWTLYVKPDEVVATEEFVASVQPAFEVVGKHMGPFVKPVRVHAFHGGVEMENGSKSRITTSGDGTIEDMQGIGPARVPAYHTRGDGGMFSISGVFMGTTDGGTAVHELVHARFAEYEEILPLWFEEGIAMLMGDGVLHDGAWVVDGLNCWAWRELRNLKLNDEDLARLLRVDSREAHSVRDNVLAHFAGWAIVFDLYREVNELDWEKLLARFRECADPVAEARLRMDRTLRIETPREWLAEQLAKEDAGMRLAAVRGTWKLYSSKVQQILLTALNEEEDACVRAALAVNAYATSSQVRLGYRQRGWMYRSIRPVFETTELESREETTALRTLFRASRNGGDSRYDTQGALGRLGRFLEGDR